MAKSDDIEDLDRLIDRAVDTFFVEASEEDDQDPRVRSFGHRADRRGAKRFSPISC